MMMNPVRLAAAALLLAACAPAAGPSSSPAPGGVTEAGLLRLADRREFDEAYLRAALAHRDPAVARRAAWVLANLRRAEGVALLDRALTHTDTSVAAMAAFALGQIADSTAVPLLALYATVARPDRVPTVLAEVAFALGKIRHPQARAALESLLRTVPQSGGAGNNLVAGAALLSVWRQGRPLPVSAIEPWLRHADPGIRWRAAYALARRGEPQAAAALFRAAGDTEPLVRSFVARALTQPMADSSGVGRQAAQDAVIHLALRDPEQVVRINALRTLGTYTDEQVLRILVQTATTSPEPYQVIAALEGMQRLGAGAGPAAAPLAEMVGDAARPVFVRQTALATLAEIDPRAAAAAARGVVRDPGWRLRSSAARAVAHARPMALGDLAAALRDPDGRVAAAALEEAVTVAGDSVAPLRDLLLQGVALPDVIARTNALGGLAKLADPATLPMVLDAYQRAQADSMNDAALAAVDAAGAIAKKDPAAARTFFARFTRSNDYLVRQRVQAAFGGTVPGAWTAPLPIETGVSIAEYARIAAQAQRRPRPHAVIETSRGEIELELFADDAPLTVRSFLSLAARGFFDGQEWPRVVPNFVIQGGDPRGDTSGGPGYSIRDEINRHLYLRGTLGMALSGPDTGGSQWFVTHSPQPHLDGTYTVFGQVVRGMEVADRILPGDRIIRIREVR
jgi:cyclophilin family peptidyl-prolyl cis-trans isomerase/HEAT repeat protein